MSGNQLYEFHQEEIQDLREAKERSLIICRWLKSLMEDIVRDDPFCSDWAIAWLLDNEDSDESYLKPVEHLLEAIAEPLDIPIINSLFHSAGSSMKLRTAHRAALTLHIDVCNCLWDIWGLRHRNAAPDSISAAAEGIVQSHWHELGKRLEPLAHFEFDVLMQKVENESAAAMERCRQSIVGNAERGGDGRNPQHPTSDNQGDKALEQELQKALTARGIRKEVATTLSLEQKRNIIMAYWDDTPSKSRDRWLENGWSPTLGTESKSKLAGKVKMYIKRGKEKLTELKDEK